MQLYNNGHVFRMRQRRVYVVRGGDRGRTFLKPAVAIVKGNFLKIVNFQEMIPS